MLCKRAILGLRGMTAVCKAKDSIARFERSGHCTADFLDNTSKVAAYHQRLLALKARLLNILPVCKIQSDTSDFDKYVLGAQGRLRYVNDGGVAFGKELV